MYQAPLRELRFVLDELLGTQSLAGLRGLEDYSPELAEQVLGEAARFAQNVLDPLNQSGDKEGAHWSAEGVTAAKGFKAAYQQYVEGGWPALGANPEFGGQTVPNVLSSAVRELMASSNLAFKLCPMLTIGAVEALDLCGSPEQKQRYLPKMVTGEWTGTMVLTEPHAGSDLGLIRTRAVPDGKQFRLFGQKIFITWGEHDLTPNIVHMVLGRIEGAPAGTRGISLFIVPKFLVNDDGSLGARNEVRCVSIEHKMGIHASPTCTLAFGDDKGAVAHLIGEPNRGLEYMFIMMNAARFAVGLEGVAIAERAYQQALGYARERLQGKIIGDKSGEKKPILHHPDVRRMLMDMKARTEAGRAIAYYVAGCMDRAKSHPDVAVRRADQARLELLTPVVKGWCTEMAQGVTWNGIQVHGGMGFIEETGACQHMRDARITTIYEGTTAIQANDLIGRKIAREGGQSMRNLLLEMGETRSQLAASDDNQLQIIGKALGCAIAALDEATEWLLKTYDGEPQAAAAGAVPFLKLTGVVAGAWLMGRAALVAAGRVNAADGDFYRAKLVTARYFAEHVVPEAACYREAILNGSGSVLALEEALF